MSPLYVALGSAVGGVARWLLGTALQRRLNGPVLHTGPIPFPAGALVVNVTGSFVIGALAIAAARHPGDETMLRLLLMVGLCGGYTTFSTFSLDTLLLMEQGSFALAAANIASNLALALLATFGGMFVMRAVLGQPPA